MQRWKIVCGVSWGAWSWIYRLSAERFESRGSSISWLLESEVFTFAYCLHTLQVNFIIQFTVFAYWHHLTINNWISNIQLGWSLIAAALVSVLCGDYLNLGIHKEAQVGFPRRSTSLRIDDLHQIPSKNPLKRAVSIYPNKGDLRVVCADLYSGEIPRGRKQNKVFISIIYIFWLPEILRSGGGEQHITKIALITVMDP